jgi:hypothetical protein
MSGNPETVELVRSEISELDPDTSQLYVHAGWVQPTNITPAALAVPLLTPWMPGPVNPLDRPVVVSATEFVADHRRDLPGVVLKGLRMRMGWYAMPGAVGLWLWSLPARAVGGSISVWASEDDLERFVGLPHHVAIMQRYGTRGTVRSTKWQADKFEPRLIVERARIWITGRPT